MNHPLLPDAYPFLDFVRAGIVVAGIEMKAYDPVPAMHPASRVHSWAVVAVEGGHLDPVVVDTADYLEDLGPQWFLIEATEVLA